METIYMIRHAESPFIPGKELVRPLSQAGDSEARALVDVFKDIHLDAVYASDFKRAIQTVQYIAENKNLSVTASILLRERLIKDDGSFLELPKFLDAIRKSYEDLTFCLEGGECTQAAMDRAIPEIQRLLELHKGETIAIGTHGNIMTIIMKYFDENYGFDFWSKASMPDVYRLSFEDNQLIDINRCWGTL